jgi:hypothetical protein
LIYTHSTERTEPIRQYPVLNYSLAVGNKQLIKFFAGLDWEVDVKQYKGGYLMNDIERWNQPITRDRIESMDHSLHLQFIEVVE